MPKGPMSEEHKRNISLALKKNARRKRRASNGARRPGRQRRDDTTISVDVSIAAVLQSASTGQLLKELGKRIG